jgi:hypothetical protein
MCNSINNFIIEKMAQQFFVTMLIHCIFFEKIYTTLSYNRLRKEPFSFRPKTIQMIVQHPSADTENQQHSSNNNRLCQIVLVFYLQEFCAMSMCKMLVMSYPLTPHKNPDDERLYYTAARAKNISNTSVCKIEENCCLGKAKTGIYSARRKIKLLQD